MSFRDKIIPIDRLPAWRRQVRESGKKLAVTNGCFDILHVGHVVCLEAARQYAGALLVGVNGDAAVRNLKGEGRPVNSEQDRVAVLAALESVSAACIFPETRAAPFLRLAEPDIYVKGGDYTLETLDPEERQIVEAAGGHIIFIPFLPDKSTTAILERAGEIQAS